MGRGQRVAREHPVHLGCPRPAGWSGSPSARSYACGVRLAGARDATHRVHLDDAIGGDDYSVAEITPPRPVSRAAAEIGASAARDTFPSAPRNATRAVQFNAVCFQALFFAYPLWVCHFVPGGIDYRNGGASLGLIVRVANCASPSSGIVGPSAPSPSRSLAPDCSTDISDFPPHGIIARGLPLATPRGTL